MIIGIDRTKLPSIAMRMHGFRPILSDNMPQNGRTRMNTTLPMREAVKAVWESYPNVVVAKEAMDTDHT